MTYPNLCPYCDGMATGTMIAVRDLAVAFADAFPVSPGHTLIVSRRHEADYFALTASEQMSMWALVGEVHRQIKAQHQPHGYNIGINVGTAAGQTVPHAHIHIIPRYVGDVPDPRGGIRWVLPGKAAYWAR